MIIIYSDPIREYSDYFQWVTNGITCEVDSMLAAQVTSGGFSQEFTLLNQVGFFLLANWFDSMS